MANTLKLEIVTPAGTVYSEDVEMVTLPGVAGQMGILPQHVPLISQMVPGEMIVRKDGRDLFVATGEGLIEVTATRVSILTDLAIPADRIDEAKAEEARQRAEARLREKLSGDGRVTVVDSRSASLGEGLLVLRGLELARAGWTPDAIARELVRVRDQSAGYFAVDNFERLVRSGRVGRVVAWLGTRLNVKPVMAISAKGTVEPAGRVRGTGEARRRVLDLAVLWALRYPAVLATTIPAPPGATTRANAARMKAVPSRSTCGTRSVVAGVAETPAARTLPSSTSRAMTAHESSTTVPDSSGQWN